VLLGVAVLAACGSDGKGKSGAGTTVASNAAAPIPTLPAAAERPLRGHLTMTGAVPLDMPKATGVCREHAHGLAREFVVKGAPELGLNGFVAAFGPTTVEGRTPVPANVKVFVKFIGLESAQTGTGVTISSDQQSITFDTDLAGGTGNSRNGARIPSAIMRGHISGTLRCT
jgi:hypothetical protein